MAMETKLDNDEKKFIPGSDADTVDIFKFPYISDKDTIDFIKDHGRVMFIIRGPPGTGKDSLANMLSDCYPECTVCSADAYFSDTFSKAKRDFESLKASHDFCHKKVKNACTRGVPIIIVKNTHIKKSEVQIYLDFAAEYSYTVIMAVTTHKMKVTPQILARSNTKGLNEEYFRRRLKQWEEVTPVNTGWFLNLDDTSFLYNELATTLSHLLGDGKFCRVLNVYCKDDLLKHFEVRKLLYCIAACGPSNKCSEIKTYYMSSTVKDHYGECFPIVIKGYIITPSYVAAVVYLNNTMQNLFFKVGGEESASSIHSLVHSMSSMTLGDNFIKHSATIKFEDALKMPREKHHKGKDDESKPFNVNHCSFMLLAERKNDVIAPHKLIMMFSKLLGEVADVEGNILLHEMSELDDEYMYCRLNENSWLIKPQMDLPFKTVFTGLYV